MTDTLGIIFAYGNNEDLRELTKKRAPASVPFGSRYRVIDFALSSLVNSGVTKIGVITREHYHSLMDHLGSGKEWDLARKRDGLYVLPPYASGTSMGSGGLYRGKMEALAGAKTFIRRSVNKYVILSSANFIFNLDYTDALDYHTEKGADITVLYHHTSVKDTYGYSNYLSADADGRVTDLSVGADTSGLGNRSMDTYIMSRELLDSLITECTSHNLFDFEGDVLIRRMKDLKICAYRFDGYAAKINSISSFFASNLDLLREDVRSELFDIDRPIFTKVRDEEPTYYSRIATVKNSLLADGCKIEGTVINSIVARGVKIKKGAVVQNSIIMQDCVINEDAKLSYIIADKDVVISKERTLIGYESYPIVLSKGTEV